MPPRNSCSTSGNLGDESNFGLFYRCCFRFELSFWKEYLKIISVDRIVLLIYPIAKDDGISGIDLCVEEILTESRGICPFVSSIGQFEELRNLGAV